MAGQSVVPTRQAGAESPSRLDIDVMSVLLGGVVVSSVLMHLGVLPEAELRRMKLPVATPPGGAILAVLSVIVVLLRTTHVLGRLAASALFVVLAGRAVWGTWTALAAAQMPPPQQWVAQSFVRIAFLLGLGGWLGMCAWRAWWESRGRRTRS